MKALLLAPLLVIAPAKKGGKDARLLAELAAGAQKQGYVVKALDWTVEPSTAELDAFVADALKDPAIDSERVVIAAKSAGVKALMASASRDDARSLLLITPNCDEENTIAKALAPVMGKRRRLHVTIGEHDEYCDPAQIRAASGELGPYASTTILPDGDHNFLLPDGKDTSYQDKAVADMLAWLDTQGKVEGRGKGLKRELCTVHLGMSEADVMSKAQGTDVTATYAASLGAGDKMYDLPVLKKAQTHTRCLVRTHEGKARFIEATWAQSFANRYSWNEFLAPETMQYGEPSLSSAMQGKWDRENALWTDARTKMIISRSVADATFYQVSIEDLSK